MEDVSLENPDTVHVTFADDDPSGAEPVPFGDGVVPEAVVETSPNGDDALKVVKTQDPVDWAGVTVLTLGSGSLVDADHYEAMMSIYAPAAGETVRLKLESSADGSKFVETDAVTTKAGWQTMRFDFGDLADS